MSMICGGRTFSKSDWCRDGKEEREREIEREREGKKERKKGMRID